MSVKKIIFGFVVVLTTGCIGQLQSAAPQEIVVAMASDGAGVKENFYLEAIRHEVLDLMSPEFRVVFRQFNADWSRESMVATLNQAYRDPDVRVVLAMGLLSSNVALELGHYPKPTVVPIVLDPGKRRWLTSNGGSGVRNLTYIRESKTLRTDIEALFSLRPFRRLGVVGDVSLLTLPDRGELEEIAKTVKDLGAQLEIIAVTDNGPAAVEKAQSYGVDAVLLLPTPRLAPEAWQSMVDQWESMEITTLSVMGEYEVEKGVLATTTPYAYIKRMARRVALNVQEIALEGKTADIEVNFPSDYELVINRQVMEALELPLSWDVVSTSRFIMEPLPPQQEAMGLPEAMEIARCANLDLHAERDVVRGGCQDVIRRRSTLGPQVNGVVQTSKIDSDRARASNGSAPERTSIATVRLQQKLYDENSYRDYEVERWLQASRRFNLETTKLDVFLETATSYLDVLRIRAAERVQRENYKVSLANLKRARDRVESGEARLSEVYRWESEISRNKRDLLDVQASLEAAEVQFNRILHRDPHTPVVIKDITFESPGLSLVSQVVNDFVTTPDVFQSFRDFIVKIARERSPELLAIRRQIGAQTRTMTAAKRAFYVPSVSATAEVGHRFHRAGAGKRLPPGTSVDDVETAVTVDLNYPLWTSGDRSSQLCKARTELRRLQTVWMALQERLDQSAIRAVDNMRASYLSIELARDGAAAAQKNLEIVSNSYARGVISIVDLIDAQNAALTSEQDSVNALYDFFQDLMDMQRASGHFDYFEGQQAKQEYLERLKSYVQVKANRERAACSCAG